MNSKNLFRLLLISGMALMFGMGFAVFDSTAQNLTIQPDAENCQGCHGAIYDGWQDSPHGNAGTNIDFTTAWDAAGTPPECMQCHATNYDIAEQTWEQNHIDCEICHSPVKDDHPNTIMPTDISSRLCGQCHLDTFAEWETSQHGQSELGCIRCHNPHTTEIKTGDAQMLCETCHNTTVHSFSHTAHAEAGMLCVDCHLEASGSQMGEGHGSIRHTLTIGSETCIDCHGDSLHFDELTDIQESGIQLPIDDETLSLEPSQVSPVGFAIIGTLIGAASGMLMAPWLERWYSRMKL